MEPKLLEMVRLLIHNNTKKMIELAGDTSAKTITTLVVNITQGKIPDAKEQVDEALQHLLNEKEIALVKGNYYPADESMKKVKWGSSKKAKPPKRPH